MRNKYTGQEFNLIRLLLISRPSVNVHHDRYTSNYYFNFFLSQNMLAIFYLRNDQHVIHLMDIYISRKDFDYLIRRLK